ncbi:MAG: AzlC family ABC transporter permease [Chloroflexota bacterium]|nr:AzlC family ABC transporter permease [Chloroflexota bacterium]
MSNTRRSEFMAGVRATIPLVIGAVPFGIIFGALAVTSGLSPAAALGMSLFVFAGSSQFVAANMVADIAPIPFIVLTTFVVNLRHALYAATLAPYMRHLPQTWLAPLGFWLTDESFVVVVKRYQEADESPYKHWFYFGSALAMYSFWQLSTIIGIVAGQSIPDPARWGLDFALVATFIGMLVPQLVTRPMLVAATVAGVASLLLNPLPNKLGLLIAAVLGVLAGVASERWLKPGLGAR